MKKILAVFAVVLAVCVVTTVATAAKAISTAPIQAAALQPMDICKQIGKCPGVQGPAGPQGAAGPQQGVGMYWVWNNAPLDLVCQHNGPNSIDIVDTASCNSGDLEIGSTSFLNRNGTIVRQLATVPCGGPGPSFPFVCPNPYFCMTYQAGDIAIVGILCATTEGRGNFPLTLGIPLNVTPTFNK